MPELKLKRRFLLLGIALAVSYWLVESVADSLFGEGPVAARILPADANEVWMRLIVVALILGFTGYISHTLERRARAKQRLQVLQSAVEQTDEAVLIMTAESVPTRPKTVYANQAFCRQSGYALEELLGEIPHMLLRPDSDRAELDRLRTCLKREDRFVGNLTNYRKDGSSFRVELRNSPVYDPAGNVTHWISVLHDITERERAEAALKESEERYRAVVEQSTEGIYFLDVGNKRIIETNSSLQQMLGFTASELHGMELYELATLPREEVDSNLRRTLKEKHRLIGDLKYRRKDGTLLDVEVGASVIRYRGNDVVCVVVRDISERKRSEAARARLAAIVESSDDAIFDKTLDGVITSWNKGAQKLYGYTAEETVGQHVSMLAPPEKRDEIAQILAKIRSGEAIHNRETVRLAKDGRQFDVSVTVSPVKNARGSIVGASIIARDITERKRAESALQEVREAERRQIARDLHDDVLQELMDALYSMQVTRMKLRGDEIDVPEIDEQISDLRKATNSLRDAINNLRQESIQKQPFLHLLRSVVVANRQKAPHIEIDLDVDASFSSESLGSAGIELLRIIQEALINVRRHSWAGHVRVSLREEEDSLTAEVVDDGRGFDPELSWGGVGVSAMQERASKLGSELEIHSEPGRGTRVTVRVPTALVLAVGASDNPSEI